MFSYCHMSQRIHLKLTHCTTTTVFSLHNTKSFSFVLDYKIKELKLQIAPRETEIMTMRKQIEEMDLELEQYHKSNRALNLMIAELKLKLDGLNKENALQVMLRILARNPPL